MEKKVRETDLRKKVLDSLTKISFLFGTILFLGFMCFILKVSSRLTAENSEFIARVIENDTTNFFMVFEKFDKEYDEFLENIFEEFAKFKDNLNPLIIRTLVEKIKKPNGYESFDYGIVNLNTSNISYGYFISKVDISENVIKSMRRLTVGDFLYDIVNIVETSFGEKLFRKTGFLKLSDDQALIFNIYFDNPEMKEILQKIMNTISSNSHITFFGIYKSDFSPLADFPPLESEMRDIAEEGLISKIVRRKFMSRIFAIPMDIPDEDNLITNKVVMILQTDYVLLKRSLICVSVVSTVLISLTIIGVRFTMNKLLDGISKSIKNIVETMEKFRSKKPTIEINLERTGIKELDELAERFEEIAQDIATYLEELEASNEEIEQAYQALERAFNELQKANLNFAQELAMIAEGYDENTGNHIYRVGELSAYIALKMGLGENFVNEIRYYARLHDIGKILIPQEILLKRGKLTKEEFEVMKRHTIFGEMLLEDLEGFKMARRIALYHHEKCSGKGYPYGLICEEIPIEAQIVSIVDVYDALRSKRPYKDPLTHEEALEIILKGDGRTSPDDFNPEILEIFRKFSNDIKELWESVQRTETDLERKMKEVIRNYKFRTAR